MIVYDAQRRPVELGEVAGQGGEATVYRLANQPGQLAKIYEPEPRPNYAGKLGWMVAHPPDNPTRQLNHPSLAWPEALLYDPHRRLIGYSMPFIQHAVPLLDVFNPRRRAEVLPQFNRRYLLRTARNLAIALSALHGSGYVAGDLNESNLLVTPTALVTMIDTDSFQVSEERGGKQFIHPCPVGKPEYTPPELQGKDLSAVIRLPDHDAFCLAVLIFQLLMEGSHPFRAQWLEPGDPPPLEARIASGAYPHIETPSAPVAPPRNMLGVSTLHPWLVKLFTRCFVDGHRNPRWRPGPDLWARALAKAEQSLICCAQGHYYSSHLRECPYCAMAPQTGASTRPASSRPSPFGRGTPWRSGPFARPPTAAPAGATIVSTSGAGGTGPAASVPAGKASPAAPMRLAGIYAALPLWARFGGKPSASAAATAAPAAAAAPSAGSMAAAAPTATAAPVNAGMAGFTFPIAQVQAAAFRGLLHQRKALSGAAIFQWLRVLFAKSLTVGAAQGALAGALPGIVMGLIGWFSGSLLPWTILVAVGGAAAGILRGWQPGRRLAELIGGYIGWRLFWQIIGLVAGAAAGILAGLSFGGIILPVIIGGLVCAAAGFLLGRKLWQVGSPLGWERIWGVISALVFGALGYGISRLLGLTDVDAFGENLANGLLPFAANGSITWAVIWALAGATGGGLSGGLVGLLIDLLARLTRLVD